MKFIIYFFIILYLTSCSSKYDKNVSNKEKFMINMDENINFDDFNKKLDIYLESSNYPDITN